MSKHEWRKSVDIQSNDFIRRYGEEIRVISTELNLLDGRIWIKVDDNGVNKKWDYGTSEELLCRRRE